eukprot:scaffold121176_cov19-Tisochrysis_lutea.AAC.1
MAARSAGNAGDAQSLITRYSTHPVENAFYDLGKEVHKHAITSVSICQSLSVKALSISDLSVCKSHLKVYLRWATVSMHEGKTQRGYCYVGVVDIHQKITYEKMHDSHLGVTRLVLRIIESRLKQIKAPRQLKEIKLQLNTRLSNLD